jgi:hypothetical protein
MTHALGAFGAHGRSSRRSPSAASAPLARAQGAPEVYNATAALKTAAGVSITAP